MDILERFQIAEYMRDEYSSFPDFAELGMGFLGFPLTPIQKDISEYMHTGPRLRMVMAQRGEAKSTLAALYSVWRLIQNPSEAVLVVSGGEAQASEVATLIIRLILQWEILEYLRPDKQAGDRTSAVMFDIHWALKGLNKSPSVACVGITANLQGKRATLLLADDIETMKNGLTVTQREHLKLLSRDFSSINTHGDILYLGTPQSKDSIYNTLPGRGFQIRIWPGRYPTDEELDKYGDRLAPVILNKLRLNAKLQTGGGIDGTRGKPTDPDRFDENALVEKELDQGPEGFQLQYMLDTSLLDAMRQQLKLTDLIVANFDNDRLPEILVWQPAPRYAVDMPADFPIPLTKMYHPVPLEGVSFVLRTNTIMYIDPAGGGTDEIGYAVSCAIGPYIHVLDVGGIKGGLTDENGNTLCDIVAELDVNHIEVESNMGHGLFETNLLGVLAKRGMTTVGVRGQYSTGQKERRIIDSLVGAMQRHKVVIHQRVFESDTRWGKQHSVDKRAQYSLFYQLANITTDRGSLPHDDRLEAMAGAVRWHKAVLVQDEEKAATARQNALYQEFMANPMGYNDNRWKGNNAPKTGTRRHIYARRNKR